MSLPGTNNGKRNRSAEDEVSEFTPLSKRINNLHINNAKNFESKMEAHRNIIVYNERRAGLDYEETSRSMDGDANLQQSWLPNYSPDLNMAQNPYYYESNRLLYELYIQRSQRSHNPNNQHAHHY